MSFATSKSPNRSWVLYSVSSDIGPWLHCKTRTSIPGRFFDRPLRTIIERVNINRTRNQTFFLLCRHLTHHLALLRVGSEREKKKMERRSFSKLQRRAMSCAMADFPAPAGPYNHRIKAFWSSAPSPRIQFMILLITTARVLGWHLAGSTVSPAPWNAPGETACWRHSNPSKWSLKCPGQLLSIFDTYSSRPRTGCSPLHVNIECSTIKPIIAGSWKHHPS